jgi:hypothetical protein
LGKQHDEGVNKGQKMEIRSQFPVKLFPPLKAHYFQKARRETRISSPTTTKDEATDSQLQKIDDQDVKMEYDKPETDTCDVSSLIPFDDFGFASSILHHSQVRFEEAQHEQNTDQHLQCQIGQFKENIS